MGQRRQRELGERSFPAHPLFPMKLVITGLLGSLPSSFHSLGSHVGLWPSLVCLGGQLPLSNNLRICRRTHCCLYHHKSSLLPSAHKPAQVESWASQRHIRSFSPVSWVCLACLDSVWCGPASQHVCSGSRSGRVCERNLPAKFSLKT